MTKEYKEKKCYEVRFCIRGILGNFTLVPQSEGQWELDIKRHLLTCKDLSDIIWDCLQNRILICENEDIRGIQLKDTDSDEILLFQESDTIEQIQHKIVGNIRSARV